MEFYVPGKSRVGFRHIHPLLAELVRSLPALVEPGALSDEAQQRFYPEPSHDENLRDLRSDWKAFVEPGLQEQFRSARDVVAADLKSLVQRKDTFEITIPLKHADAWLNVLNQARLALAADLGFNESALGATEPPDLSNERGMNIFRVNLYAFMQQCLIEQME
ncbi:MAG: DUF2017 family protein [Terrimicrobiaceae bacterium]|nr:DUF2017 family protein [Terrimicrobiaceae bacterium]